MHDFRGADSRADKAEVAIVANHPSDDHTREALAIAGAEFAVGTAAEVMRCLVLPVLKQFLQSFLLQQKKG